MIKLYFSNIDIDIYSCLQIGTQVGACVQEVAFLSSEGL